MNTIIIGKESLLTKYLHQNDKNAIIFSARDHLKIPGIAQFINKKKKS